MRHHYPLVDADAHVIETERTWDFLEPYEQKYRPQLFASGSDPMHQYWMVDGKVSGFRFPTFTERELNTRRDKNGRMVTTPAAARELDDVGIRLEEMDRLGIDVQILHNTLWIEQITDRPEIETALCRSWNRWMASMVEGTGGRLFWSCVVPVFNLEAAVEEIRFAHEHGAVAICMRAFERDLLITDPYFYPLFEEASRWDLAIAIHIGNGSPRLAKLLRTASNASGWGGWAPFRIPAVVAAHALITSGISEVFPALRWAVVEASASWIPWVSSEVVAQRCREGRGPFVVDPFSDNRIWICLQGDDDLSYLSQYIDRKALIVGTDFGHTDTGSDLDVLSRLDESRDLDDEGKELLLSRNALRLFGLKGLANGTARKVNGNGIRLAS